MTKKSFPSDTQDRFMVRLPDGMRPQIAEAAKANNRSMNAEIVARLQSSDSSSLEDLKTIRSQAVTIAALDFQVTHLEAQLETLKAKLAISAHHLATSDASAFPEVQEIIAEFSDYEPADDFTEKYKAQALEQVHELKAALRSLKEVDPYDDEPPKKNKK